VRTAGASAPPAGIQQKASPMLCMGLAFCHILANTYFPVLESGLRAALDWKHDEAERPLCGMQRRGGTASKGAAGAGFSPDAPRPLRSRRESHVGE